MSPWLDLRPPGHFYYSSAQQAGKGIRGLPSVIRFGETLQPIPVPLRGPWVFFVFIPQLSKLAKE
jgi:hypothetical protein